MCTQLCTFYLFSLRLQVPHSRRGHGLPLNGHVDKEGVGPQTKGWSMRQGVVLCVYGKILNPPQTSGLLWYSIHTRKYKQRLLFRL